MRDDIVLVKAVISESFYPPALSSSLLLGVLIDVLLEDEIPLVRFVRQDKPLEGSLRFLFRLHLFLSPAQSREAEDLVNASLILYIDLWSSVLRAKACPYGASRLNAGVHHLRSGSRALHTLLTTRLSLARRTDYHHNLVVTMRPKMLACLGRRSAWPAIFSGPKDGLDARSGRFSPLCIFRSLLATDDYF